MNKQPSRLGKEKKSKDVKGKTISSEKQPATLYEIVPGKFNENDWNNILETDESQEFIWELIDEVFNNSIKLIFEKYLQKQTVPFTINEAKKAILHIIEWQFLAKDADDDLTENWLEDEEPESCIIDNWAQGYVQSIFYENEPNQLIESKDDANERNSMKSFMDDLNKVIELNDPYETNETNRSDLASINEKVSNIKKSINNETQIKEERKLKQDKENEKQNLTNKSTNENKKKQNRNFNFSNKSKLNIEKENKNDLQQQATESQIIIRNKIIDAETKKLEESISKAPVACQSVLKTLLSRPLNMREIELDQFGNISHMHKLDFEKIPTNNIRARFSITDNMKQETTFEPAKKTKLTTLIDLNENNEKELTSESFNLISSNKIPRRKSPPPRKSKQTSLEEESDLLLDPAPGVIFTMLNATRSGPKKVSIPSKQQSLYEKSEGLLRPIRQFEKSEMLARISIEEILDNSSQLHNIKQASKQKPIPPITSHSTSTIVN